MLNYYLDEYYFDDEHVEQITDQRNKLREIEQRLTFCVQQLNNYCDSLKILNENQLLEIVKADPRFDQIEQPFTRNSLVNALRKWKYNDLDMPSLVSCQLRSNKQLKTFIEA